MAIWRPQPDGEYGEHCTTVNDHTLTVYSDRDGTRWWVEIDGGEAVALEAATLGEATREAKGLVEEG